MARRAIVGAVLLGAMLAGCFIVTGSTDGYQLADAGLAGACTGAADCTAGQVCCVEVQGTASASSVCQTGPCAFAQLCKTTKECGDAAPGCALQSCTFDGGATVSVTACGALAPCSLK